MNKQLVVEDEITRDEFSLNWKADITKVPIYAMRSLLYPENQVAAFLIFCHVRFFEKPGTNKQNSYC